MGLFQKLLKNKPVDQQASVNDTKSAAQSIQPLEWKRRPYEIDEMVDSDPSIYRGRSSSIVEKVEK